MQVEFLHTISFLYKIVEENKFTIVQYPLRKIIKQIGFKFCSFAKFR